jgi:asparagine synthase (glutamine-hydrolysing)
MAAIAGIWDRRAQRPPDSLAAMAGAMAAAMHLRGPEGGESWCDGAMGVALTHRGRSAADGRVPARQPLASSCGRYVVACEGEVYDAGEVISDLRAAGRSLAAPCDAGLILEAISVWGPEAGLRRLNGKFAGALWDLERRVLRLFRDRHGMCPLYWTETGGLFLFASELKGMRAIADFRPALDRDVVAAYLRRRCVPGPYTIYHGVSMLAPGSILTVDAHAQVTTQRYWSLEDAVQAGQSSRFAGSEAEASEQLDQLLRDAVARRSGTGSVGVFHSGGIDSAMLLAMQHVVAPGRALSFAVGFKERGFDEASHAGAVARHIGVKHEAIYLSPDHARELIPRLPDIYDEPMADVSQIPTYFLARLARESVSAAFTGDGGDEFFGGYEQYLRPSDLLAYVRRLPPAIQPLARRLIPQLTSLFGSRLSKALPTAIQPPRYRDKLILLMRLLTGDTDDAFRMMGSYWHDPDGMVIGGREPANLAKDPRIKSLISDPVERMKFHFGTAILSNSTLTKVDRATSAAGLEFRLPLLDNRLVDFGWALPAHMKLRGSTDKWLLRQVLYRYVPPALVDRPKMGFDVPMGLWLRGPLRDWAETLLAENRLQAEGIFHPRLIRERWREHLAGRRNWQGPLWVILMFQAWKARWLP